MAKILPQPARFPPHFAPEGLNARIEPILRPALVASAWVRVYVNPEFAGLEYLVRRPAFLLLLLIRV